jgi:hypothetical protein
MVERISDALHLPLRERNRLLGSAGLAQAYPEQRLDEAELAVFRSIVDRVLERHAPYPGYVLDGHWNIVRANSAAAAFLPEDGERNLVRLLYSGAWRDIVANWHEIAWPGIRRIQADAERFPADDELASLVRLAVDAAASIPQGSSSSSERVLCPAFRSGNTTVRTVSVLAQFTSPRDVTLDELRIELLYPADDEAEQFFRALDPAGALSQIAGFEASAMSVPPLKVTPSSR